MYSVYNESGQWLADHSSTGAALQQVIWLDDLPVGVLVGAGSAQKLYYIQPDHLGTPRVVIDPVRNVAVWRWDSDGEAFGNTPPHQDPDADGITFVFDMRFPGQRYDASTGLNYNYFRNYEANTGRYAESDLIGLAGGLSTYAYVGSAPLSYTDPYGLDRQFSLGLGGTGFVIFLGTGGSINLGISVPKDLSRLGCYQLFGTVQGNLLLGTGGYLGGGVQLGTSKSSGALPALSGGVYRYLEVGGGWGTSLSGSVQGSNNLVQPGDGAFTWVRRLFDINHARADPVSAGTLSVKPGVGFGGYGSGGYTVSGTVATPTWSKCECQ